MFRFSGSLLHPYDGTFFLQILPCSLAPATQPQKKSAWMVSRQVGYAIFLETNCSSLFRLNLDTQNFYADRKTDNPKITFFFNQFFHDWRNQHWTQVWNRTNCLSKFTDQRILTCRFNECNSFWNISRKKYSIRVSRQRMKYLKHRCVFFCVHWRKQAVYGAAQKHAICEGDCRGSILANCGFNLGCRLCRRLNWEDWINKLMIWPGFSLTTFFAITRHVEIAPRENCRRQISQTQIYSSEQAEKLILFRSVCCVVLVVGCEFRMPTMGET